MCTQIFNCVKIRVLFKYMYAFQLNTIIDHVTFIDHVTTQVVSKIPPGVYDYYSAGKCVQMSAAPIRD